MSKSNCIENKDGTVVVALDYGMSWDYEDAIKEFPSAPMSSYTDAKM